MHKLLEKQLNEVFGSKNNVPKDLDALIALVDRTYSKNDEIDLVTDINSKDFKRLKLATDNLNEHLVITNVDGIILYANKAAETMTGYSRKEMEGKTPSLWGRQMSADFYKKLWHTIKSEKHSFSGEITNKRKSGELYLAMASITPVVDENDQLQYFIAVERDITKERAQEREIEERNSELEKTKIAVLNLLEDIQEEKKKVDATVIERTKELSNEKARLLASINSLSFGFIIADMNDNILLSNPAMYRILDIHQNPKTVHEVAKSFEQINLINSCKECVRLKRPIELKDISYGAKFVRIFCAPINNVDIDKSDIKPEETIGYVFIVEDVTEAKVLERSKDEFFAVASHELRTPLTAIRGNSDMILSEYKDKIVDKDMKEMLSDINESSIRLIGIVNDFLETSRLEQGKMEMSKEKFDLVNTIDKVLRNLQSNSTRKGVSLTYSIPKKPLPAVFADKNRTEQVLINLIGNADKYTKSGSITIDTILDGGFIKVLVTDTGAGISEQVQSLLFRKFQPAGEQVLSRDFSQSTGLGLYISKLIVSGMGGTIGLEKSELKKGSAFFFTLPIAP